MDTNVGGGFPVASQVSVMSSAEKVVTDSGWAVITGGLFTVERVHNHTPNIQLSSYISVSCEVSSATS